jgi:ABC-type transport system involved in multi-copper enzyme maturation permease subunit
MSFVNLVRAELLKARRRQATWVIFIVMLVLLAAVYLVAGAAFQLNDLLEFPSAYAIFGFVGFGLGSVLALVYAAAIVGGDWSWGVLRNVISRGESRSAYLLAKLAALAIVLGIAFLILFAFGILMTYVTGLVWNVPVASPLRGRGLADAVDWMLLTYPVLVQRAAIGAVVAIIMRSQLAGVVVGVLLFFGEPILRFAIATFTLLSRGLGGLGDGFGDGIGLEPIGPEWFQFLPITVGDYVANSAPGALNPQALEGFILRPVPLDVAFLTVGIYLLLTVGLGLWSINRQEIA